MSFSLSVHCFASSCDHQAALPNEGLYSDLVNRLVQNIPKALGIPNWKTPENGHVSMKMCKRFDLINHDPWFKN
jgi:hypothetical protein